MIKHKFVAKLVNNQGFEKEIRTPGIIERISVPNIKPLNVGISGQIEPPLDDEFIFVIDRRYPIKLTKQRKWFDVEYTHHIYYRQI